MFAVNPGHGQRVDLQNTWTIDTMVSLQEAIVDSVGKSSACARGNDLLSSQRSRVPVEVVNKESCQSVMLQTSTQFPSIFVAFSSLGILLAGLFAWSYSR